MAFFGSTWWLFDWFANFRWQLMWLSIMCTVAYYLAARGIAAVVFLVAVVVNAWLIAPLWLGSQPRGTGEDGVRVVAVDLYGGADDSDAVFQWLDQANADIIIAAGVASNRLDSLLVEGSDYRVLHRPAVDTAGIAIVATADYPVEVAATPTLGDPILTVTVPSGSGTAPQEKTTL